MAVAWFHIGDRLFLCIASHMAAKINFSASFIYYPQ
jgi:hypothetical protein